jgi:hypothetical protein
MQHPAQPRHRIYTNRQYFAAVPANSAAFSPAEQPAAMRLNVFHRAA